MHLPHHYNAVPDLGDPVLTRADAALYLGVSTRTLDREAARGALRPFRRGRIVRYRLSQLVRYLEDGTA